MLNNIKCLMIGQTGIGKSKFLSNLPNSELIGEELEFSNNSPNLVKENYRISCLSPNGKKSKKKSNNLEEFNIEFENYDITLETCLNDSESCNKIIKSSKFINTCNSKIIILCFALDDPTSFELIKSKWEIDFEKNKNNKFNFILLGLKSDLIEKKSRISRTTSKFIFKKNRSSSLNSISSTAKLQLRKKRTTSETEINSQVPLNQYKKFAKEIGTSLIQATNVGLNIEEKINISKELLDVYVKLLNNIFKMNSSKPSSKNKVSDENMNTSSNLKSSFKSKIPKSLTAPINFFSNIHSRKQIKMRENENLNKIPNESNTIKFNKLECSNQRSRVQSFSIKKKISQLFIGIGTYIVTCGTSQSRKFVNAKYFVDRPTKLINKDKSWLLLASEASLNNIEDNDEVFVD